MLRDTQTLLLATRSGRKDRLDMSITWGANPDRLDNVRSQLSQFRHFRALRPLPARYRPHVSKIFRKDALH